ncbi:hypothetical protein EPN44_07030 [bacterium]|nr:MAG: hypothetical protein EPN44_07030 [bacterium]
MALAAQVGLPMDPPRRNVNSRAALETGELVRERFGDESSARFHHAVTRAFFAEGADIADLGVLARLAAPLGLTAGEVEAAWRERRCRAAVDQSLEAGMEAGVRGVPAFAWEGGHAVMGMRDPESLVEILTKRAIQGA